MVVLPAPVGPDDGDLLPGFGVEGEIVDDDLIRVVAEVDIFEVHAALDFIQLDRSGGFRRFFRFGQELEDALCCGSRLLEDVGDIGDLRDRLGKGAHILDEGLDVADGNGALDGQVAAQDADCHITQVADKVNDRV